MKSFKLTVSGRVQGVWYRKSIEEVAKKMGIFGTVKNLKNGSVEIIVNLDEGNRSIFIDRVKTGSPKSKVENIIIQEIKLQNFSTFKIDF